MDIVQVMQLFIDQIDHKSLRGHISRGDVDAVIRCGRRLQQRYYVRPRPLDRLRHYNSSMTVEGVPFTLGEAALGYVVIDELINAITHERGRIATEFHTLLLQPPAAV